MSEEIRLEFAETRTAVEAMAIVLAAQGYTNTPVEWTRSLQVSDAGRPDELPLVDRSVTAPRKLWWFIARRG